MTIYETEYCTSCNGTGEDYSGHGICFNCKGLGEVEIVKTVENEEEENA